MSTAHRSFARPMPRGVGSKPVIEMLESRQMLSADVFGQVNLVSDGTVPAAHVDKNLKNPWGVSFSPSGAFWVSDNNAALSTLYDGNGVSQGLLVSIPGGAKQVGTPTGQVYNGAGGFTIHEGTKSGSSLFIFAGEDGGISGWNPSVDFNKSILAFDGNGVKGGAVYKGLAIGAVASKQYLYAANFRSGNIDVLDSNFKEQSWAGAFKDSTIPAGFAPFNVQNLNGVLFVTYAKQDAAKHDDVKGNGNGMVDEFDTSGHLLRRLQRGFALNSPWGLAIAPKSFDKFAGDILVGNFGSGRIDAFNPTTGNFAGFIDGPGAKPIVIDGLWAITPGNGGAAGSTQALYFTAGINHEQDGLFGKIVLTKIAGTQSLSLH